MDLQVLISQLHPLERKVLPVLREKTSLPEIILSSGLQDVEVMRALQWLQNKELLKITTTKQTVVLLDKNGIAYQEKGLPEKILLKTLTDKFESVDHIAIKSNLSREEIQASIGILKPKNAIMLQQQGQLQLKLGGAAKFVEFTADKFLQKSFPIPLSSLSEDEKKIVEELRKRRNIIKVEEQKKVTIELTSLGKKASHEKLDVEVVNRLTPELLKSGAWKDKQFRAYDVKAEVPSIYGGKKHFVNQSIDYGKKIWLEMGFQEMIGPKTVTSFWNFDALFTAQDHPVREMQDTFFIKGVEGKLPDKKIVERVKKAHESGVGGSKGWQYTWKESEAKKVLLRTHTTCLSSRTLSQLKKEDLPAKFFSIGKCFRNETVDWKHGFEFNQTEGIVIDPNANFRHLLGYLKELAKKMGFPKVRFQPSYFPYTEPSVEGLIWSEEKKEWIEVFAAGIFRPEVTIPLLGEPIPVLAWGPGFDRLMMMAYHLSDLREMYANDLKQMRELAHWKK